MLFQNVTTIEDLERKRSNTTTNVLIYSILLKPYNLQYSLGTKHNFQQVFGPNFLLWLLPTYGESGMKLNFGEGEMCFR